MTAFALEKVLTFPADVGPQESSGRLCTCGQQWKVLEDRWGLSGTFPEKTLGEEPVVSSLGSAPGPLRGSASFPLTQVGAQVRERTEAETAQLPGWTQQWGPERGAPRGPAILCPPSPGAFLLRYGEPCRLVRRAHSFSQGTAEESGPVKS